MMVSRRRRLSMNPPEQDGGVEERKATAIAPIPTVQGRGGARGAAPRTRATALHEPRRARPRVGDRSRAERSRGTSRGKPWESRAWRRPVISRGRRRCKGEVERRFHRSGRCAPVRNHRLPRRTEGRSRRARLVDRGVVYQAEPPADVAAASEVPVRCSGAPWVVRWARASSRSVDERHAQEAAVAAVPWEGRPASAWPAWGPASEPALDQARAAAAARAPRDRRGLGSVGVCCGKPCATACEVASPSMQTPARTSVVNPTFLERDGAAWLRVSSLSRSRVGPLGPTADDS